MLLRNSFFLTELIVNRILIVSMLSIKYVMFFFFETDSYIRKILARRGQNSSEKRKEKTSVQGTIFFRWDCIVSGNNPFQNAINSC